MPAGYARAGELTVTSYNTSYLYHATLTPDGQGTWNVASVETGPLLGGAGG